MKSRLLGVVLSVLTALYSFGASPALSAGLSSGLSLSTRLETVPLCPLRPTRQQCKDLSYERVCETVKGPSGSPTTVCRDVGDKKNEACWNSIKGSCAGIEISCAEKSPTISECRSGSYKKDACYYSSWISSCTNLIKYCNTPSEDVCEGWGNPDFTFDDEEEAKEYLDYYNNYTARCGSLDSSENSAGLEYCFSHCDLEADYETCLDSRTTYCAQYMNSNDNFFDETCEKSFQEHLEFCGEQADSIRSAFGKWRARYYDQYFPPAVLLDPVNDTLEYSPASVVDLCELYTDYDFAMPAQQASKNEFFTDKVIDPYVDYLRAQEWIAHYDNMISVLSGESSPYMKDKVSRMKTSLRSLEQNIKNDSQKLNSQIVASVISTGPVFRSFGYSDASYSRSELHNLSNIEINSCVEYVYNKYFSQMLYDDKTVELDNFTDMVKFAYATSAASDPYRDYAKYAIGSNAARTKPLGTLMKLNYTKESYKDYLSKTEPIHPLTQGISRHKNLFIEMMDAWSKEESLYSTSVSNSSRTSPFSFRTKALNDFYSGSSSTVLDERRTENWAYYRRMRSILGDKTDDAFDGFREIRRELIDLLILRARLENTSSWDLPAAYRGTFKTLSNLQNLTQEERELIDNALDKPIEGLWSSVPDGYTKHSDGLTVTKFKMIFSREDEFNNALNQVDERIDDLFVQAMNSRCLSALDNECDWLPEMFVEKTKNLVPASILNYDYDKCYQMLDGESPGNDFLEMRNYQFTIPEEYKNGDPCGHLSNDSDNGVIPKVGDKELCQELLSQKTNYIAGVAMFEKFPIHNEFFKKKVLSPAMVKYFKKDGSLYVGVTYSDSYDVGSDKLGIEGGYGIAAGLAGLDKMEPTNYGPLRASFLAHAYSEVKLFKKGVDLFNLTAYAGNQTYDHKITTPNIDEQVGKHAEKRLGKNVLLAELEILGKNFFQKKVDSKVNFIKIPEDGSPTEKVFNKDFFTQTIPCIIPLYFAVGGGFALYPKVELAFQTQDEHTGLPGISASFIPTAEVFATLDLAVGFDAKILALSVGLRGALIIFRVELPLTYELTLSGSEPGKLPKIMAKNSLKFVLSGGAGFIALFGRVQVLGWDKKFEKKIWDFRDKPLFKKEYKIYSIDGEFDLNLLSSALKQVEDNE